MEDLFMSAMHFRHACKLFKKDSEILNDDMDYILEAGRMSPSSFGLEHWHFLDIRSDQVKEALEPVCWNQPQITSCSNLVVILGKKNMRSTNPYVQKQFKRRKLSPDKYDTYMERIKSFVDVRDDAILNEWSARQCYIAAGNMMTAAACRQIDSCPIEGFEREKVESVLNIDCSEYFAALLVAFGFRGTEQQERLRLSLDEVVTRL